MHGLAAVLRRELERLEWTQQQLADAAGVGQPVISLWLSGARTPSRTSMRKVAGAFKRPVSWMYREAEKYDEKGAA